MTGRRHGRGRGHRRTGRGVVPGGDAGDAPGAPGAAGPCGAAGGRPVDRGAVTAELAVGMVSVTVVLAAVLATGAVTVARLGCVDAARTGARVAARGQTDAEIAAAARHVLGGRRADVRVSRADGWATVTVAAPVAGPRLARVPGLGVVRVDASATAWVEP